MALISGFWDMMVPMTEPLILSFQVAGITTIVLALIGIPLAFAIAFNRGIGWRFLEASTSLPLVLPSTVIGFYLLLAFSPNDGLGEWLRTTFNWQLAFSIEGIILASIIYSLPFMVQPLIMGFRSLPQGQIDAARLMGLHHGSMLMQFALPAIKPFFARALLLCFVHTLGEFGAVLMIGGNIAGQTQTLSIALYEHVELLQFDQAHPIALTLMLFSLFALLATPSHKERPNA